MLNLSRLAAMGLPDGKVFQGNAFPALSVLTFGALQSAGNDFVLAGAALSQPSVDGLLENLARLDGTGGTSLYANHVVNLTGGMSSPPSAGGLAAAATLTGRGCTVTHN